MMNTRKSVFTLMILISLMLSLACGRKSSPFNAPAEADALEVQKSVNRYFHKEVIPRLAEAWNQLPDTNKTVTYHYRYTRKKAGWGFQSMEKVESNLSGHSDTVAMMFMAKAVAGTTFPVEKVLAQDTVLDLYWTWPVPFPEGTFDQNTGEFTALRPGGGNTGGCDGRGTKPHCTICGRNNDCPLVCVGFNTCDNQPGICWELFACASGGPFGRFSNNIIQ